MTSMLGLKPIKTKFPTLISIDNDNKVIKSTTTTQKIQRLTNRFNSIFTHDNAKPNFDNKHKVYTENELTKHIDKTSTLKEIPYNYKTTEYTIAKADIETTIDRLNTKKANGPDKICNKVIKHLKP